MYPGEPVGIDNGAYRDYLAGNPFDERRFLRQIDRMAERDMIPELAAAPDMVGEGVRSLDFSCEWLPRLPDWPWYLVLQDGMFIEAVAEVVDRFAGLFLGGTDQFKYQAGLWSAYAHANGLPFHYGRCGTTRKLEHAVSVSADSLDSCTMMWTMPKYTRFANRWMQLAAAEGGAG